jgi:hypothetical protein
MPRIEVFERVAFAALALLAGTGSAAAQHLWTVDDNGPADFATIQDAVDAAADGDVVQVFPGSYAGFQIASKGLAILGDSATPWTLSGPVSVTSTVVGQTVVISGFTQLDSGSGTAAGIAISACAGAVRTEDCAWRGQNSSTLRGGSGARIENSSDVIFSAANATGGNGGVHIVSPSNYSEVVYGGGHALDVLASSLAFWGGSAIAGLPGTSHTDHNLYGYEGGSGALLGGALFFASNSLLKGGQGGKHSLTQCGLASGYGTAGDGGAGLRLESAPSSAFVQQPNVAAGPPGTANCAPFYVDGNSVPRVLVHAAGSTLGRVPSPSRKLTAPAFVAGTTLVDLTATGAPGDLVYAVAETSTHFQYDPALHGVWSLAYPPQPPPNPDAVIPSGGSVGFQITLPAVPPTQDAEVHFVQLYIVDLNGRVFVSTPRAVVLAH